MSKDVILSMYNVRKTFGAQEALKQVSFEVKKGEVFGFLGPSGAGKTTTVKLFTAQLLPTVGEVRVMGQEIYTNKENLFKNMGVLTDTSGLYDRLSIMENLMLFASAALHNPSILFLDEPTAALDPGTTLEIHKLLKGLNEKGTTLFLTTHDMMEADKLCDRVAFLHEGTIVDVGAPEELKRKYANSEISVKLIDGSSFTLNKDAKSADMLANWKGANIMFNFNRFLALVIKELQDLGRNKNVLFMVVMPLGFCVLYKYLFIDREGAQEGSTEVIWQVMSMCLSMSLVMISGFASAMMIAEEKEKMTLRSLLLSGLTPLEFILGKAFISTVLTTIVNLFIYFYMGISNEAGIFIGYFVITIALGLLMNLFGALIGVIAPNQMSTGVVGMPMMMVFLLLPLFASISESFSNIARFVPIRSMNLLLEALFNGQLYGQMGSFGFEVVVIVAWTIIGFVSFDFAYKRMITA